MHNFILFQQMQIRAASRALLAAFILILLICAYMFRHDLLGNRPAVNLRNAAHIRSGMKLSDVESILGGPCDEIEPRKQVFEAHIWRGPGLDIEICFDWRTLEAVSLMYHAANNGECWNDMDEFYVRPSTFLEKARERALQLLR